MKPLVKWQRWEEHLASFPKTLDRIVRHTFRSPRRRRMGMAQGHSETAELRRFSSYGVPADVCEGQDNVTVTMEVPGLSEKDLQVELFGNILRVSGERQLERGKKGKNYRVLERSYGAFSRSFTLPSYADTDCVEASYVNGVLTIQAPKRAGLKRTAIAVRAAKVLPEKAGSATA
jgi:HSP20 family molecular chaperone IbpA